jgi:trehalose synthase
MAMIDLIDIDQTRGLDEYAAIAHLAGTVQNLRTEASHLVPALKGRTVWMVNSTARGGGVAEMLPMVVKIMRDLGVQTEWAVMGTERQEFFPLTKKIHNLIHGHGTPELNSDEKELYDTVSRENAAEFKSRIKPEDILVIHDPQPLGMGTILREEMGVRSIWRCHIGLDVHTPETRAAWGFLRPYAVPYNHAVFSTAEYIPDYLAGCSSIIRPGLDPLSHKNRELSVHKLVGILCNSHMAVDHHPVTTPFFAQPAMRLQPDGEWKPAIFPEEIGLMYRPIVTQVSRWDYLKGFRPLLDGFVQLKKKYLPEHAADLSERSRRRLEIVRLVLAGPDPASIQDDPEGKGVLQDLVDAYAALEPELQNQIVLLTLPMDSRKENALMVNTLQRCSSIIVQNSLREGFGLTATEAMWKRTAILGTQACGLRNQIRDKIDGRLVHNAGAPEELAAVLVDMLDSPTDRDYWARNAQRRVHDESLVFTQVRDWLRVLAARRDPKCEMRSKPRKGTS